MTNKLIISNQWNGKPSVCKRGNYEIGLKLNLESSDLIISIDAPYFHDPVPTNDIKHNCHGLWNYEVVEIFIASGLFDPESKNNYYLEIEVGPHGHWYICTFPSEGAFSEKNDDITLENLPFTIIDKDKMRWHADISIPCYLIPEPLCGDDYVASMSSTWMMNAFAIHGIDKDREYLAYNVVPIDITRESQPNFHQLKSFVPVTLNELYDLTESEENTEFISDEASDDGDDEDNSNEHQDSPSTLPDIERSTTLTPASMQGSRKIKKVYDLPFRPSDWDPEVKKRAFEKQSALKTAFLPITIAEMAQHMKTKYKQPEIPEQYTKYLFEDEYVILYGDIVKRSGWSYKKRRLLLTSKPRLLYLKNKTVPSIKGIIPWTMTRPIKAVKIDDTHFDIMVFESTRIFHIHDQTGGSSRWIDAISSMTQTWSAYLQSAVGQKFDLRVLADSLKSP